MSGMAWTKVRLCCKICGNAISDAGGDSPIQEVCPDCLLEFSPVLLIGEGYIVRECTLREKTAPQGSTPAEITIH